MNKYKENIIVNLTFEFALEVIDFTERIKLLKKYNLADQLFRSGTSIGANVSEAQNAESKADLFTNSKYQLRKQTKLIIG